MKRWLRRVTLAALLGLQIATPAMAQQMASTAGQIVPTPGQMMPAPGQIPALTIPGTAPYTGPVIHNMIAPPPQVFPPPPVPIQPPWPVTINPGTLPRDIPPPVTPGPVEGGPWRQAIITCLNQKGLGCQATHNTVGCGSCYGHYLFIFGSCRMFYGDQCLPIQPGNVGGYPNGMPAAAGPYVNSNGGLGAIFGGFGGQSMFGNGSCSSCGGN